MRGGLEDRNAEIHEREKGARAVADMSAAARFGGGGVAAHGLQRPDALLLAQPGPLERAADAVREQRGRAVEGAGQVCGGLGYNWLVRGRVGGVVPSQGPVRRAD